MLILFAVLKIFKNSIMLLIIGRVTYLLGEIARILHNKNILPVRGLLELVKIFHGKAKLKTLQHAWLLL